MLNFCSLNIIFVDRMDRFRKEFSAAVIDLNGDVMFDTCFGLAPGNVKHGKATTLNRALKVLKTLGLVAHDTLSWSSLPVTAYSIIKAAFVKSCQDGIRLKALSDAVLEGFIPKKMPKSSVPPVDKAKSLASSSAFSAALSSAAASSSSAAGAEDRVAGLIANRIALLAEAIADPFLAAHWLNIAEPEPAANMPAILDAGAPAHFQAKWQVLAEKLTNVAQCILTRMLM